MALHGPAQACKPLPDKTSEKSNSVDIGCVSQECIGESCSSHEKVSSCREACGQAQLLEPGKSVLEHRGMQSHAQCSLLSASRDASALHEPSKRTTDRMPLRNKCESELSPTQLLARSDEITQDTLCNICPRLPGNDSFSESLHSSLMDREAVINEMCYESTSSLTVMKRQRHISFRESIAKDVSGTPWNGFVKTDACETKDIVDMKPNCSSNDQDWTAEEASRWTWW